MTRPSTKARSINGVPHLSFFIFTLLIKERVLQKTILMDYVEIKLSLQT